MTTISFGYWAGIRKSQSAGVMPSEAKQLTCWPEKILNA